MARPGFMDWLCQAGKTILRLDRMPIDGKTIKAKNNSIEVDASELISATGGLVTDSNGKVALSVGDTMKVTGNALNVSDTLNSATATKLANARSIAMSGAVTATATNFDDSGNITIPATALDVSKANAGTLPTGRGGTGRTDGKVASLVTARALDGVNFDGSGAISHYGTCATAAATAAKVVAITGFVLVTGARVTVRFTVANTANNPTLNVNNTGAKAIRYRNAAIERFYLEADRTYDFVYDGTAWQLVGDLSEPYELCEFYYFRHPDLRRGFEPLTGAIITGASTKYPRAWAYLQTTAGKKLCKTESEWQALSTKIYYNLADGTGLGFNGIGGVPFFVQNTSTGTLRMPDIRGTFPEPAGFDSLNVGGVKMDAIREAWGNVGIVQGTADGIFYNWAQKDYFYDLHTETRDLSNVSVKLGNVVPVANVNRPRSYGVMACAYLGQPAS